MTSRFLAFAFFALSALSIAAEEDLRLMLGRSHVLKTEKDISRIAVGDPSIVSLVVMGPRELLVSPRRVGHTNIILWHGEAAFTERIVRVEPDYKPLRDHLARIDPNVVLETGAEGQLILSGNVVSYDVMRAAIDIAARWLEGTRAEAAAGIVIGADTVNKDKPEEKTPAKADFIEKSALTVSSRIKNLMVVKELPQNLQDRMQEVARGYSGDIRVRRLLAGVARDASQETFVMEGSIANPASYFQLLTLLDAMLGGNGADLGGLNLGANGSDMPVVRLGGGRLMGLLRIHSIPLNLEKRMEAAAKAFGQNLTVRRIQRPAQGASPSKASAIVKEKIEPAAGGAAQSKEVVTFEDRSSGVLSYGGSIDDTLDLFILEGSVQTQSSYTRVLTLLSAMLSTTGEVENEFEVLADDGGGLLSGNQQGGRGGIGQRGAAGNSNFGTQGNNGSTAGGGISRSAGGGVQFNNITSNIGRSLIVRAAGGRLISFVKVVAQPQVLVSVRVLELNRNKLKDIGTDLRAITANFRPNPVLVPNVTPSSPPLNGDTPSVQNVTNVLQGLLSNNLTFVDSRFALDVSMQLLEQKGLARSLSEPNLLTLSGEVATFLVGTRVSFPETVVTTANQGQTITQTGTRDEDFGVKLSVRPIVGEDGTITLDVYPEISKLLQLTPDFRTSDNNQLQTSVRLKSGQGLVLGGLISITEQQDVRKPPVLGRIPVVGDLLGRKVKSENERELVFVLIPRIIEPESEEKFSTELPPVEFPIRGGSIISAPLDRIPMPRPHLNIGEESRKPAARSETIHDDSE